MTILLKPEIVGFKDQTSLPFHQVIYEVSVHANPKPKVTWTKNGENLCNNDNCEVIADVEKEIYRLVILSVNPKDEGPYTITASNKQGETVAQAQLLLHGGCFWLILNNWEINFDYFFLVEKPEFVKLPEDQTIHDFSDVGVKIRAVGVPTPTLKWLKDGYPIDTSEIDEKTHAPRVSIETSGIKASETQNTSDLTIPHFGPKDVGVVNFTIFFFILNFF